MKDISSFQALKMSAGLIEVYTLFANLEHFLQVSLSTFQTKLVVFLVVPVAHKETQGL